MVDLSSCGANVRNLSVEVELLEHGEDRLGRERDGARWSVLLETMVSCGDALEQLGEG